MFVCAYTFVYVHMHVVCKLHVCRCSHKHELLTNDGQGGLVAKEVGEEERFDQGRLPQT